MLKKFLFFRDGNDLRVRKCGSHAAVAQRILSVRLQHGTPEGQFFNNIINSFETLTLSTLTHYLVIATELQASHP